MKHEEKCLGELSNLFKGTTSLGIKKHQNPVSFSETSPFIQTTL